MELNTTGDAGGLNPEEAVSSHPSFVMVCQPMLQLQHLMGTLTILVLSLVTPAGLSHRLHHHDARGADER